MIIDKKSFFEFLKRLKKIEQVGKGQNGKDGAQGPQGPAGADGAQGPAGPAGADGAQGPAGPAGADGAQGEQGIQGIQGFQGLPGVPGADGADGAPGMDGIGLSDGWVDTEAMTYEGADAPSFTFSIASDVTGKYSVGMRIKLVQTTTKYFIITKVGAYSAGKTIITVYGGTDYTLTNAAITSPKYSIVKVPFGFPMDPLKWTITMSDTTNRSQASPTVNVWYNIGSLNITIPIGAWRVFYDGVIKASNTGAFCGASLTLSNTDNSESDANFTTYSQLAGPTGLYTSMHKENNLNLTNKTKYYLNALATQPNTSSIGIYGASGKTLVCAVCAYL